VAKKVAKTTAAAKAATASTAAKKKIKRREYTADDVKLLKRLSKERVPVAKISKQMKRTEGSLRQKARSLGIGLGHYR